MSRLDYLLEELERRKKILDSFKLSTEDLLRIVSQFRLDWGDQNNNTNDLYNIGATKPVILSGLSEPETNLKKNYILYQNNEIARSLTKAFISNNKIEIQDITAIHRQIFKSGGLFRKSNVYATDWNANISTKFSDYARIESELNNLLNWLNDQLNKNEIPPIVISSIFHHQLVNIHPYTDGNGRFARILSSLILLHYNYPPPSVSWKDREIYLDCLRKADLGDISPFISFLSEKTVDSISIIIEIFKSRSDG